MNEIQFRRSFLILLVVFISAVFVAMIRNFLITILLAAIFSGMAEPLYSRFLKLFRGRKILASISTLLVLMLVIVVPFLGFLAVAAREALRISEAVRPAVAELIREPGALARTLQSIPGFQELEPYREQILTKVGQLVEGMGNFVFQSLSATTKGTISFFFQFFLLLYTMFYFLMQGDLLLRKILYYLPLPHEDEIRMVDKFVSVARATLKGTLIIGVIQGTLAGAAFAVAGVQGAVFWGTVMMVLSIIPGIGTTLIWGPAVIYLIATGHLLSGALLGVFCLGVVGSVDNFLRPRLVGQDAKMHDLLILFSTLGGIYLFGIVGFIIGPIVAAIFVTIWDIYGTVFRDVLPPVGALGRNQK